MKQGRTVIAFCCSLLLFSCTFLSCNQASETSSEKPSESSEEISYLSNIPTYTPPNVVPSEPLHIDTSHTSFQWIRSIGPDLDMNLRSQPSHAQLFSTADHSSQYVLTNSTILKINELGEKEWSVSFWEKHEISGDGFLDGIQFDFLQITPEGNIVVAGSATSNELSSPDAWQPTIQSTQSMGAYVAYDGFLASYSPKGDLLWSTYLGGSGHDGVIQLSVRSDGIYVLGSSQSPDFYTRVLSQYDVPADAWDKAGQHQFYFYYIMKFSFDGQCEWTERFQKPSTNDSFRFTHMKAIQDTPTGFIFLCTSNETSLPVVKQASTSYSQYYSGRNTSEKTTLHDSYLFSIDLQGNMLWSTYLGGSGDEFVGTPSESPKHNVPSLIMGESSFCVIGESTSTDYPLLHPLQDTVQAGNKTLDEWWSGPRPQGCPVITCFSYTGELLWSTYLGGPFLTLTDALMDKESVFITGNTTEPIFPIHSNSSDDNTFHGSTDGVILQIDPKGNLVWSTYFGEDKKDTVDAISIHEDILYFTGSSDSSCFQTPLQKVETSKETVFREGPFYSGIATMYVASLDIHTKRKSIAVFETLQPLYTPDPSNPSVQKKNPLRHIPYQEFQSFDLLFLPNHTVYCVGVLRCYLLEPIEPNNFDAFQNYDIVPSEAKALYFLTQWSEFPYE
jgi:hypothetical protein